MASRDIEPEAIAENKRDECSDYTPALSQKRSRVNQEDSFTCVKLYEEGDRKRAYCIQCMAKGKRCQDYTTTLP